jgi:hypothetical protein
MRASRRMSLSPVAIGWLLAVTGVQAQQAPAIELELPTAIASDPARHFTWLTGVHELSDGSVIVVDSRENRLEVLDTTLRLSTTIGREGDGPGEFRRVGWIYPLAGDSSIVTDPQFRHWYLLERDSIVQRITGNDPALGHFDPIILGADASMHVLGARGYRWTPPRRISSMEADSLVLLLGRLGTTDVDTIAVLKGQAKESIVRRTGTRAVNPRPFTTEDLAQLFGDGWIAVARVEPYRVEWRRPDGQWIQGPPLPVDARRIGEHEKCAVIQAFTTEDRPCDPDVIDAPEMLPAFLPIASPAMFGPATPTLHAMPDGRLLIRRTPGSASNAARYDIVDRRGRLSATLALPVNEAVVGFGEESIWIVATDAVGLQTLRRHPWPE